MTSYLGGTCTRQKLVGFSYIGESWVFRLKYNLLSYVFNYRARRITQHLLGRTTADKVTGTFSFTISIRKSLQKAEYHFRK